MSEVKRYWIYKGTSNFCQELILDDDYETMVKQKPEGFYDIVSTADTIESGVEVVLASEYEKLKAQLEKAEKILSYYASEDTWIKKEFDKEGNLHQWWDKMPNDKSIFPYSVGKSNGNFNCLGRRAREYFKEKELK